jgi:pimeloyl-ACP methyl ester carboxylesterase
MSADEVEALRSGPRWPLILAGAASAAREARTEESWVYRPGQFDRIAAPTLLLAGSASPEPIAEATRRAADAIPDSRIQLLDGHGHFAHRTDPAVVGAIIRDFLRS